MKARERERTSLVIGAGISGCAAGLELARAGRRVVILEQDTAVGGKVLDYCCKAAADCSRCGVCAAHTLVGQALREPRLRFLTSASLAAVRRQAGGFSVEAALRGPAFDYARCLGCEACSRACPAGAISRHARGGLVQLRLDGSRCLLRQGRACAACREACPAGAVRAGAGIAADGGRRERLEADQVLVAAGHEPFQAARKVRLGHGRIPGVLTGAEAEALLSRRSALGGPGERVAFVQCVGSRDPRLGRNWCSAVCCAYALRLARMLRHRDPAARLDVHHIDIQNFDPQYARLRRELEEGGVRFVPGLPYSVQRAPGGKLKLSGPEGPAEEGASGASGGDAGSSRPGGELYDKVVLSVGLGPAEGARELAALLGLGLDGNGFLRPGAEGVFVTGTCREPQSIGECIASARAEAQQMLVQGGGA